MEIWNEQEISYPNRLEIPLSIRDENAIPEGARREFISSSHDVDELPSRREPRPVVSFPSAFRSLSPVRSKLPFEYWKPKVRSASGVRPSFSGMQDKVCCVLEQTEDGFVLRTPDQSRERGNVILKPTWGSSSVRIGINEAFCMTFSALCGDTVPRIGLVPYGFDKRFPQAHYFVERFDTNQNQNFECVTVNEFLGQETSRRGQTPLPDVLAELAPVLSDDDWGLLMKRLVISFIVGNGDLHLKNLSLCICHQDDGNEDFSVSLAPSYDIISTAVLGDKELFALPMDSGFENLPLGERNRSAFEYFLRLLEEYADIHLIVQTLEHVKENADTALKIIMTACGRDIYPEKYIVSVQRHLEQIAELAEQRAMILRKKLF